MNGRVAKKLRRLAETATVGKPEVAYRRRTHNETLRLKRDCTRGMYRVYKRVRREAGVFEMRVFNNATKTWSEIRV